MTNLEAIKGKLSYPLSENAYILALTTRGLISTDNYAGGQAFDLAYADLIIVLLTTPNITEGSYSVSLSDRAILIKLASAIYTKYGVDNPLSSLKPTAKFVQRW